MTAARILCIIVLLLEVRGLSLSIANRKWKILIFYTQLSNLAAAVSALLLVLLGEPAWVTALRYLSTCMLIMTFLVTACVLVPMGGDPKTRPSYVPLFAVIDDCTVENLNAAYYSARVEMTQKNMQFIVRNANSGQQKMVTYGIDYSQGYYFSHSLSRVRD